MNHAVQQLIVSKYEHRKRFKRCGELPNSQTMVSDDSERLAPSIYRNHPLVTEQFARMQSYKKIKRKSKNFLAGNWHLKWICRLSQMLIEISRKISLQRTATEE